MHVQSSRAFFVILLALCGSSAFCQSVPAKTAPADLALEWVDASGKVSPQLIIRTDYYAYPGTPSFRTFLSKPAGSSPEAFLAHYIQALPDTLAATAYHDPAEEKISAAHDVAEDQRVNKGDKDLLLNARWQVGAFTLIIGTYIDAKGKSVPAAYYGIHTASSGYRITEVEIGSSEPSASLFFETGWSFNTLGTHWNTASKPKYRYSLSLPGPYPVRNSHLHPLTVLFNGIPSHLLIDSQTMPPDPISAFVKHVVQTYRSGTQEEWLALWTPADIQRYWDLKDTPTMNTYKQERLRFSKAQFYQVFTLNFGPNAVVFLAAANAPDAPLSLLLLWKGSSSEYHLTQGVRLTPDGFDETFDGNIQCLFNNPAFQNYLKSIARKLRTDLKVDQPRKCWSASLWHRRRLLKIKHYFQGDTTRR